MIKYKVITDTNKNRFEQDVSEYLNNGWKLATGYTIQFNERSLTNVVYSQALIKEDS